MKIGDKLKIIEVSPHRKDNVKTKETIGKIIAIDKHKVTIVKIKNGKETFNESFTIGDFKTNEKKIQIKSENGWESLKLTDNNFARWL